jgi:N-acetylglucosaminyldiphosphoundecaprenol N-acetyl-beta-D-mannosaminyltransferase
VTSEVLGASQRWPQYFALAERLMKHSNGGEPAFVELVGLGIARVSSAELLDRTFLDLAQSREAWLTAVNVDILQRSDELPDVRALYAHADLVVADGAPVIWAAKVRRNPLPERIAGSVVWSLPERAAREARTVCLLGGGGDAATRAPKRLRAVFAALRIAGHSSPWLSLAATPEEIDRTRRELSSARPDLFLAGFGLPKATEGG